MMLRRLIGKCLSTSTRLYQVGPVLAPEQVQELLLKPTWSVKELLADRDAHPIELDGTNITKVLKMSGLDTNISQEEKDTLVQALRAQMVFIQHLYEDSAATPNEPSNDSHFRLLPSDHIHSQQINLDSLLKQIQEVPSQVDPEKGENGFDIASLGHHNSYFTIRSKTK